MPDALSASHTDSSIRRAPKVICLGGAVQDFVFSVDDMPHEAKKYRAKDFMTIGGGCAANAAVAAQRLGGQVLFFSRLGDDLLADTIIDELKAEGLDCRGVRRFEGFNSSLSAIVVDNKGERMVVGYRDRSIPADTAIVDELFDASATAVLADTRWTEGATRLFELAKAAHIPSVLDIEMRKGQKEIDAAMLATHPAFSVQGLYGLTGEENLLTGLKKACALRNGRWTTVTDGARGVYVAEGDAIRHLPGFQVEVVDTLGAGDVWHGALALALAEGQSTDNAVIFASAAAALKCTEFGGRKGTPNRAKLNQFLADKSPKLNIITP